MMKRIIISGAPGTGKTSIISALESLNHHCFQEVSREIIAEQLKTGGSILPWEDLKSFSKEVIRLRKQQHVEANENLQFYDRSIIDSLAYLSKDGIDIPSEWDAMAINNRYYPKVFITTPWEAIYTTDTERKESFECAQKIHNHLIKMYLHYGYKIIEVPKTTIEKRIKFILAEIEK